MGHLIIGKSIVAQHLIKDGDLEQIKHSTYDLTIGEIFPSGEKGTKIVEGDLYYLKPRQSVLVISKEEFGLPATVTGLATLRTTLTKSGLLALNVGIIDPFFNGPITTTLINFSEREVPIKIGMSFFRVLFFEHEDTTSFHRNDESKNYGVYREETQMAAYRDFPKSFLNLPQFDNRFYAGTALKMIKGLSLTYWYISLFVWIFLFSIVGYVFQNKEYWSYLSKGLKYLKATIPFM